jgi:hypothetical protein
MSFLVLMTLWVATPKEYIHYLFQHNHAALEIGLESKISTATADDCDFENYNKPSYFSLFNFICSFIPSKKPHAESVRSKEHFVSALSHAVALFRGPPVTE